MKAWLADWWPEVLIGVIFVAMVAAAIVDANSHRDETCAEWRERPPSYVIAGKVIIPIESRTCEKWVAR